MVDAYSDINTTIVIQKLGGSEVSYTGEIFNYNEEALKRTATYEKVVGGLILPTLESPSSKKISFEYVGSDLSFESLFDDSDANEISNWSNYDKYKVALKFTGTGSELQYRLFYNCYAIDNAVNLNDSVLKGKISFSLPMKNFNGDENFVVVDTEAKKTAYDTTMGY